MELPHKCLHCCYNSSSVTFTYKVSVLEESCHNCNNVSCKNENVSTSETIHLTVNRERQLYIEQTAFKTRKSTAHTSTWMLFYERPPNICPKFNIAYFININAFEVARIRNLPRGKNQPSSVFNFLEYMHIQTVPLTTQYIYGLEKNDGIERSDFRWSVSRSDAFVFPFCALLRNIFQCIFEAFRDTQTNALLCKNKFSRCIQNILYFPDMCEKHFKIILLHSFTCQPAVNKTRKYVVKFLSI